MAISPTALDSYYIRQVEFESAFARLAREKRDDFILPILVRKLDPQTHELPIRLAGRFYLDFTRRGSYHKNLKDLVRKVKLQDVKFTGQRWYKGLDISSCGEPVGVGEVAQMATVGASYLITWDLGTVTRVDVYFNGKMVNYKQFVLDASGRVVENMMYSPDGQGGWHVVEDIWYYGYDDKTGRRRTKFMKALNAPSGRQIRYDDKGAKVEEMIVSIDPANPDLSHGYTRRVFEYPHGQSVVREHWYDENGVLLKTEEHAG